MISRRGILGLFAAGAAAFGATGVETQRDQMSEADVVDFITHDILRNGRLRQAIRQLR